MAVCRRCGSPTNGPDGCHNVPDERRVARADQWLDGQAHIKRVQHAKDLLNN
jgi:hypothetical protein